MLNPRRILSLVLTAIVLAGCGGGGGSPGSPAGAGLIPGDSYALRQAFAGHLAQPAQRAFTVSGALGGLPLGGSGVEAISAPRNASFEGRAVDAVDVLVSGTILRAGLPPTPLAEGYTLFLDAQGLPAGSISADAEVVPTAPAALPERARVGEAGTLYAAEVYPRGDRRFLLGRLQVTWALEPAGPDRANLRTTSTARDPANVRRSILTRTWRISRDTGLVLLEERLYDDLTGEERVLGFL
jgi:hypothetical protein